MTSYVLIFIVYGFLGWCVEVLYVGIGSGKFYNRGFVHLPILPIYAFGALTINLLLQPVITHPILVYFLGVIVTTILEYITSYIMEKAFQMRWWDYSHYRFNINGRVCLKNSLLFGILCLFVMYGINPIVLEVIANIDPNVQQFIANMFIFVFTIDIMYTLRELAILPVRDIKIISGQINAYKDGKLKSLEELSHELENHHFGDGYLIEEVIKHAKLKNKRPIVWQVIALFSVILIIGLAIDHVQALLITTLLAVIFAYIVYNQIKSFNKRINRKH